MKSAAVFVIICREGAEVMANAVNLFIAEVLNKHREVKRKRQDNYRSTREASGDIGKDGAGGKGRKGDIRAAQSPWNHSELRRVFPDCGEICMGAQRGL